jgi:hypothetical protein
MRLGHVPLPPLPQPLLANLVDKKRSQVVGSEALAEWTTRRQKREEGTKEVLRVGKSKWRAKKRRQKRL